MRFTREQTITREEWLERMASRRRNLTDPHKSNTKASQSRIDAAGINPADDCADVLARMIAERQRRRTNEKEIRTT